MTEDEAKTKWCCGPLQNLHTAMFNAAVAVGDAEGHYGDLPSGGLCIGSACMAWRWEVKVDVWLIVKVRVNSSTEGYCGLAGRP